MLFYHIRCPINRTFRFFIYKLYVVTDIAAKVTGDFPIAIFMIAPQVRIFNHGIFKVIYMKQRAISSRMMTAFLTGELSPLLNAVQMDDTLDLEFREDSVNIYSCNGSIFKITESSDLFSISFDINYCLLHQS